MFKEFKKFIARGNVIDLAVGVVIGAAFSGIVTQLTDGVIMPLIGAIFGDIDFSNWFIRLGDVPAGYEGSLTNYEQLKEAGVAMIGYGALMTAVINFLIVAFALFLLVRSVNKVTEEMQRKAAQTEDSSTNDDVPTNPELDVLKKILAELRRDGVVADTARPTGETPLR
ncbi:large conductance mechanosensitive channel protein MscL [Erythrobacter arachoides]|uniref:Large-conductance mechanosensitive channel n=1 Tax=Aurantiacibacter arachoides TaxID=1850444 RepID=A0A845A1T1_9SPHN|nr:large conductance mechanosensitive channel protein MscL [Aurantiacibacter arachoides]MXO93664.1 large conductance mechanosensitive channel protein MscL [Aurantiacibacter arachoides]GGD47638.1 large-conductance mechanosensitive channel [Aurantiacibacter arachoides]